MKNEVLDSEYTTVRIRRKALSDIEKLTKTERGDSIADMFDKFIEQYKKLEVI